jgi:ABC-type Fe3+-hydroxamate transport system substrate-binding protein
MSGMTVRRLTHEFIWLGPFVLLCLMAVTLFRPWTTVPPVAQGRVILDGAGREVIVPEPFQGVITGADAWLGDFVRSTHAPEAVLKIGDSRSRPGSDISRWELLFRIYPQLVRNDALWDFPADTESVLAKDTGGVYLHGGSYFKEFGLTMVNFGPESYADRDNVVFTQTRVLNRIVGGDREELAEALIERYRRGYTNLAAELRLETLAATERPRVMAMIFDGWDRVYGEFGFDARLGLRDPTAGYMALGRESDAERILAMEPDAIVLYVGDSGAFLRDPRWRGMEVVQTGRVYSNVVMYRYSFDIDYQPLGDRWVAEIAYLDRLSPKLRDLMRDYYQESYGYRLSDVEIDELLNVGTNRTSTGYARFMKDQGKAVSARPPFSEADGSASHPYLYFLRQEESR